MELINYSPNHILMKVIEEDGFVWFFIGFYGWPEAQNKEKSWQLLKHLRSFVNGAWLCAGDFNAILHSTEKLSVRPPNSAEIDAFRSGLDSCNFEDLGFRGYTYTWSNKRPGEANTKLRLDRAVATMEWRTKFQISTVSHLPPHALDHLPILVHVKSVQRHQQKFRKGFKFEEAWLLWEDCGDVVKEAWELVGGADSGLASIKEKIKFCGEKLKTWGSSKLEPNEAAMKVLQNRLEVLNSAEVVTDESKVEYLSVSKQLDDLLLKKEIYWAQRSRILWLKHGDKNTKFFHSKASQRRRKNFIKGIQCTQGNWVDEEEEIAKVATDYFDNLFCAGTCDQMEECLNAVPRKVSPDMQGTLSKSPNCSFVWRSLVAALPVLRTGHCWRVGDGFSINVYRDRWIPNYPTNKPLSSVRVDEEEVLVSSLINHDLQVWRRDFIMANFNREEGEAICDILLSRRHVPDSVYWKHSKDGNFTVKSAYKVAKSLLKKEDWAGSSSGGGVSRVWAAIWKLRIPNKMKVFGWRACHDILPTRRNLKKKRVLLDELCPVCSRDQESTIHALWECEAAQDIWHGSARALQKCGTGQTDFITLLEYLLDRMEKTEVELMIVQAWLIWNQRNRVVHGGKFMDPGWLNKRAVELLEEYQRSQDSLHADAVQGTTRQVTQNVGTSWQPPPQSVYKLNYDAAMFIDNASSGFGVVIRNFRGEVMAAMTAKGPAVQCSEEAELLACRKAMEFAIDAGFTVLIVEGDSVNAMRSIISVKENQSALGHVIEYVDDSSDIEGIDLGTFGQPIDPPPGFSGNDDEHDNFDDFDDL
ncbi:hypothetical protein SO802_005954 [Lithocarpus litseifolius]|uniref:Reverse transcriptase zinc-binding domain-containing protein n=1 Tax=Lithocarpus litseifolius TaxID=425828 RepID=A0AAW2DPA1_9ROSI